MHVEGREFAEIHSSLSIWMTASCQDGLPRLHFSVLCHEGSCDVDGQEAIIAPSIDFTAPFLGPDWHSLSRLSFDEENAECAMSASIMNPQMAEVDRFDFSILERTEHKFKVECSVKLTSYDFSDSGRYFEFRILKDTEFSGVGVGIVGESADPEMEAELMLSAYMQFTALSRPVVVPRVEHTGKLLAYEVYYAPITAND